MLRFGEDGVEGGWSRKSGTAQKGRDEDEEEMGTEDESLEIGTPKSNLEIMIGTDVLMR